MAAFISGAQLCGYLEFPASSMLQGGRGLLGTARGGVFGISSPYERGSQPYITAALSVLLYGFAVPRKPVILAVTFIPIVFLPQAQVFVLQLRQKV